jgi:hypothetical protein
LEVLNRNEKNLSKIERETYEFIKDAEEIVTRNLPDRRMFGVIPSLKTKDWLRSIKNTPAIFDERKRSS